LTPNSKTCHDAWKSPYRRNFLIPMGRKSQQRCNEEIPSPICQKANRDATKERSSSVVSKTPKRNATEGETPSPSRKLEAHKKHNEGESGEIPLRCVKKPTEMQRRGDSPPSYRKRPHETQRRGDPSPLCQKAHRDATKGDSPPSYQKRPQETQRRRKLPLRCVKKPTEMQRRGDPPPSCQKCPQETQRRGKLPLRCVEKPTEMQRRGDSPPSYRKQRNRGGNPSSCRKAHRDATEGDLPLRCVCCRNRCRGRHPTEVAEVGEAGGMSDLLAVEINHVTTELGIPLPASPTFPPHYLPPPTFLPASPNLRHFSRAMTSTTPQHGCKKGAMARGHSDSDEGRGMGLRAHSRFVLIFYLQYLS